MKFDCVFVFESCTLHYGRSTNVFAFHCERRFCSQEQKCFLLWQNAAYTLLLFVRQGMDRGGSVRVREKRGRDSHSLRRHFSRGLIYIEGCKRRNVFSLFRPVAP